jgi:DNA-binding response OmpR family regulator
MSARILVAEDDPKQADVLRRYLEREGYAVFVVHDGRSAIDEARRRRPDLLVLDVMMPRIDGLDVCRVLRAESDVPIIILTARAGEDDLLLGLDLGADDYLAKPYSPRELTARVRTILRRAGGERARPGERRRIGQLEVDTARHEVRMGDRLVDCTPAEFKILAYMAAEPGRVRTRQQLLDQAFGYGHYSLDRTVDVHIMNLRQKLEPEPAHPAYLRTVYGFGYKLVDPTTAPAAR